MNIQTLDGFPDKTTLEDIGAKTNAAFNQKLRGNVTFFSGNKKKDGRGAGRRIHRRRRSSRTVPRRCTRAR